MPIKPGTLDDFANSMAAEIETQLDALLTADGLPGLPMDPSQETRDRRRLFVAIARGVVQHLHDHESSIVVRYRDNSTWRTTSATLQVS